MTLNLISISDHRRRVSYLSLLPVVVLAAVIMACTASAWGAQRDSLSWRQHDLWATVNVCDTQTHPGVIGIRGSMPALPEANRLFMRFRVQYQPGTDRAWRFVKNSDSEWIQVAKARNRTYTSGSNFTLAPPEKGTKQLLRGYVDFQWRHEERVIQQANRVTTARRGNTIGADPAGFSAATCKIAS